MSILNLLQKTEPTYFPFQVVKSDDGGGNLVDYDSDNPTTGWTAPMASPFDGLWLRVEFSDYYVNFKHNGTTWVEYNKEAKGSSIVLYSLTESLTGLKDESGNNIYVAGTTWNSLSDFTPFTAGTSVYYKQIQGSLGDINIIDYTIVNERNFSSLPKFYEKHGNLQTMFISKGINLSGSPTSNFYYVYLTSSYSGSVGSGRAYIYYTKN